MCVYIYIYIYTHWLESQRPACRGPLLRGWGVAEGRSIIIIVIIATSIIIMNIYIYIYTHT